MKRGKSMDSKLGDVLDNDPWLLTLPEIERTSILSEIRIKRFSSGQILIRKGDDGGNLFRLLSGRVKAGATSYSGGEITFAILQPGEWFGEISLLDGRERTHDSTIIEDAELAIVPKDAINRLCRQYPQIYQAVVQLVCNHCRQAYAAIDAFLLFTPEQRLASRLLQLNQATNSSALIKIKQQELSGLVGVSRQSINKILKKWEALGWISLAYNSVKINASEELSELTQH